MKLLTHILKAPRLLNLVLVAIFAFGMVTSTPISKTSNTTVDTATPAASFRDDTNSLHLQKRKKHKSHPYWLAPEFGINMSQDKGDFVPGTLREVRPPRGGATGALYLDIMYYQQGTLRLKTQNKGPDIWIPNTWFCDAKRNRGGCIGSNFIDPMSWIPNTKIRYDGDRAYLYETDIHAAVFEKVNSDVPAVKDMYRYLPPGAKPWDRAKWNREHGPKPKCNPGSNVFGLGKKICDAIENISGSLGGFALNLGT